MITLEQIRTLEQKVHSAVRTIELLKQQKQELEARILQSQKRTEELEALLRRTRDDQAAIEKGILSALDTLDRLEDEITGSADDTGTTAEMEETEDEVILVEKEPADTTQNQPDRDGGEQEQDRELDIF